LFGSANAPAKLVVPTSNKGKTQERDRRTTTAKRSVGNRLRKKVQTLPKRSARVKNQ